MDGSDVYVLGTVENSNKRPIAKVWKNGVATNLTDGTDNVSTASLFRFKGKTYAAGILEKNQPFVGEVILWTDSQPQKLADHGWVSSVFVAEK